MATRVDELPRVDRPGRESPARRQAVPPAPVHRACVRRVRRLHRPGQLRHEHRRRLEVRLHARVGDRRLEPDGDAHPDAVREARHRHRTEPPRGLPRALLAPDVARAVGAGRGDRDGDGPRRVPRRCDRLPPALRHRPLPRDADHGRDDVRDPRAATLRLQAVRGRDHRLRRRDRGVLHRRALVRPPAARDGREARGRSRSSAAASRCCSRSGSSARR